MKGSPKKKHRGVGRRVAGAKVLRAPAGGGRAGARSTLAPATQARAAAELDAHVRAMMAWHFNPKTGSPFWLARAHGLGFDPRKDVRGFADLKKFPHFEDDWLRGGPVRQWIPRGLKDKPAYVFETGGSTGVPKTRVQVEDFRIDYEAFSKTLSNKGFPRGADWLMLGPSGPRRLRLAVEHLCQFRGGHLLLRGPRPPVGHQADQAAAKSKRRIFTNSTASTRP